MICPKCEYEYVDGIKVCADCGTVLIPVEEFEGHLLHPSDWVVITAVQEMYEAEMIKANLLGGKIESLIYSKQDRNFPVSFAWESIKIIVKKSEVKTALQIIGDIKKRTTTESAGEESDET